MKASTNKLKSSRSDKGPAIIIDGEITPLSEFTTVEELSKFLEKKTKKAISRRTKKRRNRILKSNLIWHIAMLLSFGVHFLYRMHLYNNRVPYESPLPIIGVSSLIKPYLYGLMRLDIGNIYTVLMRSTLQTKIIGSIERSFHMVIGPKYHKPILLSVPENDRYLKIRISKTVVFVSDTFLKKRPFVKTTEETCLHQVEIRHNQVQTINIEAIFCGKLWLVSKPKFAVSESHLKNHSLTLDKLLSF